MKVKIKNEKYELEQFTGDFSTGIITKLNGFGFTQNAPGVCSCGRGIQDHILYGEKTILCPGDFVLLNIKKKEFKFFKQEFFEKMLRES